MAWGLTLPNSFGAFFPIGDYLGWEEELVAYFDTKMPPEKKALLGSAVNYMYFISQSLKSEPGQNIDPDIPPYRRIDPREAPKKFKTESKYDSLGSMIMLTSAIVAIDEKFKIIIERFESNIHHFFPIEILMPRDKTYPEQYYIMEIGRYIDSFSPEKSDPKSWRYDLQARPSYFYGTSKKEMSGLALSTSKIGAAHLWRESRLSNMLFCFSDQLMTEIALHGLRLPKHYRLKAV